ncbi:uncharacterized protein LOC143913487 [Arctopsyche grandis]|uniref:uncharacterized protein LOC143913487 n=1 Tax=Arctopsyche grandis TaxID=121162 RepID=UPI00406D964B
MECRLCLCSAPAGSFVSIHDDPHSPGLAQRILTCCRLQVRKDDNLPDMICHSCVNNLELLDSFRNACSRSDKTSRVNYLKVEPKEVLLEDLIWEDGLNADLPPDISNPPDGETPGGQITSRDNMAPTIDTNGHILAEELSFREALDEMCSTHFELDREMDFQNNLFTNKHNMTFVQNRTIENQNLIREVFQIIPLCSGRPKLNARGYIMLLEKKNGNRHYWHCNQKKNLYCPGRVITLLVEGNHMAQKFLDHNHPASPHNIETYKLVNAVKSSAKDTEDLPNQIIQTAMASTSEIDSPHLPTVNALRCKIHRIRRENRPTEPQVLSDMNVLPDYRVTHNNQPFLLIDVNLADDMRILVFSTSDNIRCLSRGEFWIMDGASKTVPTLFYQLYTIHTKVGFTNSRILPMVYVLMTSKSQAAYTRLFEEMKLYAATLGVTLAPRVIISDLEKAAIHASQSVFPGVESRVCFFHFEDCLWRNIQRFGLAQNYQSDTAFSLKLKRLMALAFVPADGIPAALEVLRPTMPVEANVVVEWLDEYYVNGKENIRPDGTIAKTPPLYPPEMWSIYPSTVDGMPHRQNVVENWHRRWEALVGRADCGFHKIIVEFQKEQKSVESVAEQILAGASRPTARRATVAKENRINLIMQKYERCTILDYLQELALNLQ